MKERIIKEEIIKEKKQENNSSNSKTIIFIISLLILIICILLGIIFLQSKDLKKFRLEESQKDKSIEQPKKSNEIKFCSSGGCAAKLGPKIIERVLSKLEKPPKDPNLLVGYESSDDASVYKLTEDIATVHTLDFFPPMIEDPYTFGKIAATNALSDIYAMGATPVTALNIVCFPINWDMNILGKIMQGGNEKVIEAGASISGGHSINDDSVKYGLSVTGVVHPGKILKNFGAKIGDKLILTKPLGVGITTTAYKNNIIKDGDYDKMIKSMTTLNKYAMEILLKYRCHALTDVTGFGLLVHTSEMVRNDVSCKIYVNKLPLLNNNLKYYVDQKMITGASPRNEDKIIDIVEYQLSKDKMWYKYLLLDPQTSGGLLCSIDPKDADKAAKDLSKLDLESNIIGEIIEKKEKSIYVLE